MMPQTENYDFMPGSSSGKPSIKKKKKKNVNLLADFKMSRRELHSRKKVLVSPSTYFS